MSIKIPESDTESHKLAFLRNYIEKVEEIQSKHPNCRFTKSLEELEVMLKESPWSCRDAAKAFHGTLDSFRQLAEKWNVPYVYANDDIKKLFKSHFAQLPPQSQKVFIYYSPEDLARAFASHVPCSVTTVLVPLTMLSDHPETLRSAFLVEKERRCHAGELFTTNNFINRLATWDCMEYVKPEFRPRLGGWHRNMRQKMMEQDKRSHQVILKPVSVTLTEDCLPKFYTYAEISRMNGYNGTSEHGKKTARFLGMAQVQLHDDLEAYLYTYGPRVGTAEDEVCYEIGLLDLWTAEQFVEVFGAKALNTGKWLVPKGEASWSAPDFSFSPAINFLELKTLLALDFSVTAMKNI